MDHERFFMYVEPSRISTAHRTSSSSLSLPIYQIKAVNFIKQTNYCISMVFGMPFLILPTSCHKYNLELIEKNEIAFDTLVEYLRENELMLICRLNSCSSASEVSSGHFILSCASDRCLLLRSIASNELLLPLPDAPNTKTKRELDQNILSSLANFLVFDHQPSSSSSSTTRAAMALHRLQQDFRQLIKNKVDGIDASPSEENFFIWNAIICGPEDSIYESGAYQLQLTFSEDYPLRPPQVRFLTKVFHPNVWWDDGFICVDILKDGWLPSYDVLAILHSIRLLLADPNPLSPANLEAALLYRDNRVEYNRRVSQMIQDTLDTDDDDDDDGNDDNGQIEDGDALRQKTSMPPRSVSE
ncbi:unnamed protein product [Adineta ricciae]|nr:unnamed protein product [Adineta ricciae]